MKSKEWGLSFLLQCCPCAHCLINGLLLLPLLSLQRQWNPLPPLPPSQAGSGPSVGGGRPLQGRPSTLPPCEGRILISQIPQIRNLVSFLFSPIPTSKIISKWMFLLLVYYVYIHTVHRLILYYCHLRIQPSLYILLSSEAMTPPQGLAVSVNYVHELGIRIPSYTYHDPCMTVFTWQ